MNYPFTYESGLPAQFTLRQLHKWLEDAREQGYLEQILLLTDKPTLAIDVPGSLINEVKIHLFRTRAHKASNWAREAVKCAHCPVRPDPPFPPPTPAPEPEDPPATDDAPPPPRPQPEPPEPDPDDPEGEDDETIRRRMWADELRRLADQITNPGRHKY